METSETNKAVMRKADDQTTINQETPDQEAVGRDSSDRRTIGQDDVDQKTNRSPLPDFKRDDPGRDAEDVAL